jgi:uncharacterized coiled-coil protein SlyX
MEERIIELETKIAYLENIFNELNEVVIEQDKSIKKISSEFDELKKQICRREKRPFLKGEKPQHFTEINLSENSMFVFLYTNLPAAEPFNKFTVIG